MNLIKKSIIIFLILISQSCATDRVVVKNCEDLAVGGYKVCDVVK